MNARLRNLSSQLHDATTARNMGLAVRLSKPVALTVVAVVTGAIAAALGPRLDVPWPRLFPITSAVVLVGLVWAAFRRRGREGIELALYAWAAALLLSAIPLWEFDVAYSLRADAFVAASICAVAIGYVSVRRPAPSITPSSSRVRSDLLIARILAYVGLTGSALLLAAAIRNGVSLSFATLTGGGLSEIRQASFEAAFTTEGKSIDRVLGSMLAPAGYLYLAVVPLLGWRVKRDVRVLVYLNFAAIVLVAFFLYAGRQSIVVAVLLVAVGVWLRGIQVVRINFRRTLIAVAFVALGLYFVAVFALDREKQQSASPAYQLRVVSHARYAPWIYDAANTNRVLGGAILQLSYFGSPLPSFSYYTQQPAPGPYYGQNSFPYVFAMTRRVNPEMTWIRSWPELRQEVFEPYERNGYFGNVWATMIRDVVVDWGYGGALVFLAVFGAFTAWARNAFELSGGVYFHALEAYAVTAIAFGAFQSLLYPDFTGVGFVMALGVVVFQSVWLRRQTG